MIWSAGWNECPRAEMVDILPQQPGPDHRQHARRDNLYWQTGGQKRRLSIACEVLYGPVVPWFDEPTGAVS
jgi:energy-coupling factor transporter ATP-binding protein EcfA2